MVLKKNAIKKHHFVYLLSYNVNEQALCRLEMRQLFEQEDEAKVLVSELGINPSHSAFLKKRIEVLLYADTYEGLLQQLEEEGWQAEQFKVEYVTLPEDNNSYRSSLKMIADIGYRIQGIPNIKSPEMLYGLCYHDGFWCLGLLHKNDYAWKAHQLKPRSFSNSIHINIAKALVNVASRGDRSKQLLDACCGVGTVLLEACFAGQAIVGCDVNWRVCVQSRENLAYFDYEAFVLRADIADVDTTYDAVIIDLPYNLFSCADEDTHRHIITSAARVASRLVIVSTSDITSIICSEQLTLKDHCCVKKRGKKHFERRVWVCESANV